MPITAADPAVWGLASDLEEDVGLRRFASKTFYRPVAPRERTTILVNDLHYQTANGFDDANLDFQGGSSGTQVVNRHRVRSMVGSGGLTITKAATGHGIKWLFDTAATVDCNCATYSHQGLDWQFEARPSGVRAFGTVPVPLGRVQYNFPFQVSHGAADSGLRNGRLDSCCFTVQAPVVIDALGNVYEADWIMPATNTLGFVFDDRVIPRGGFPYRIDPSTTIKGSADTEHCKIRENATSSNITEGEIRIGNNSSVAGFATRSPIQWDIAGAGIPGGSTITKMTMKLYESGQAGSGTVEVRLILLDWDEGQTTWNDRLTSTAWNTAGCRHANDRQDTASITKAFSGGAANAYVEYNNATMDQDGQDWFDGTKTNNGYILNETDEFSAGANTTAYDGANNATAAQRPELVLEYTTSVFTPKMVMF